MAKQNSKRKNKKGSEAQSVFKPNSFNLSNKQKFGLVFLIIAISIIGYFYPMVFEGKEPPASDIMAWKGNAQSILEARETTDSNPLWANNVFGGMPAIMISVKPPFRQPIKYVINFVGDIINWRVTYYLIGVLGMLLIMRFWRKSYIVCLFAAAAYIWWPHLTGLLEAGHTSKFRVMMLLPLIFWSFLRLLKETNLLNICIFIIAFSLGIQGGHYQIMFYICLALFCYGIVELIQLMIRKDYKQVGIKTGVFGVAILLAVGIASFPALMVHEYTQYSTRAGNETNGSNGLSYDYATSWSLHPAEMMTFIIPKFYGGHTVETYRGDAVPQLKGQQIPAYWGHKASTSVTDYVGILTVVFAVIAIVFLWRKKIIYSLFAISLLSIFIALGKYFPLIYDLFFNYVPFFNKFRVPIMILVLLQFALAILAGFGLELLINNLKNPDWRKKHLPKIGIIVGVFFLLGLAPFIIKSSFAFSRPEELTRYQPNILELLKEARYDLMKQDTLRMLMLLTAVAVMIFAYAKEKLSPTVFGGLIVAVLFIDLLGINDRYLNNLVTSRNFDSYFTETATNKFLKSDTSRFRILPLGNLYNDSRWSYHHESIGGYHPAKLQLIQDINEHCLYNGTKPGFGNPAGIPLNWNVLNMLNVKYLIAQGAIEHRNLTRQFVDQQNNLIVYENKKVMPRVYAVGQVEVISDDEERFAHLNDPDFDPDSTAILETQIAADISQPHEFAANIIKYEPNQIDISVESDKQTLLVLSEIYYPAGWRAFIDGKETRIYKTNHLLRSVILPQGSHKIEFLFQPPSYSTSTLLSGISTTIVYLGLVLSLYQTFYRRKGVSPESKIDG